MNFPEPPPRPRLGVSRLLIAVFLGVCLGASGVALAGLRGVPSIADQVAEAFERGCRPIVQAAVVPRSVADEYAEGLRAGGASAVSQREVQVGSQTVQVVTAEVCDG